MPKLSGNLIRENEAAAYIGVTPATLQKWRVYRMHLPFVRSGGRIVYRVTDLDAFLAARTVQPTGRKPARAARRRRGSR